MNLPQKKRSNLVRFNQKEEIPEEAKLEFSMTGNALSSGSLLQIGESGGVVSNGNQSNMNQNRTQLKGTQSNGNHRNGEQQNRTQQNGNRLNGNHQNGTYQNGALKRGTLQSSLRKKTSGSLLQVGVMDSPSRENPESSGSSGIALNNDKTINDNLATERRKVVMKGRRATPNKDTLPSLIDIQGQPLSVGTSNGNHHGKEHKKLQGSRPPRVPRERDSNNHSTAICDLELDLRGGPSGSPVDIIRRISSVNERSNSRSPGKGRLSRENSRSPSTYNEREIQPELVLVSGTRIS